ncbi:hypothetical protein [Nocardiopsis sp. CNT312]|uniref:hypothetical protein n=1 Tax=Nocardiopsis sp. CNT312 TaxID=1137268 RepID=UPI00048C8A06|nr:hypothetical protein [Nocardiopsis sp. CNT312]
MSFFGILIGLIVLLVAAAALMTHYEKSVHTTRLASPTANPAEWLPEAMDKAARGGLIGWSPQIEAERDDAGELVNLHCELRSDEGDTILVDVPAFPAGDCTDAPVVATVVLGTYTLSSARGAQWFKVPASYIVRRRRKVQRVLKRHARRSAQSV